MDKDKNKDKKSCRFSLRLSSKEKLFINTARDYMGFDSDSDTVRYFLYDRNDSYRNMCEQIDSYKNKKEKNFYIDESRNFELLNYDPETGSRTYYDSNGILVIDIRCKQEV